MNIKIKIGPKFESEVNDCLDRYIDRIGDQLVATAKDNIQSKTGKLKDSIEIKEVNYETKKVTVGSDLPYAKYIELGTSTTSAKPFLRPAIDNLPGNLR